MNTSISFPRFHSPQVPTPEQHKTNTGRSIRCRGRCSATLRALNRSIVSFRIPLDRRSRGGLVSPSFPSDHAGIGTVSAYVAFTAGIFKFTLAFFDASGYATSVRRRDHRSRTPSRSTTSLGFTPRPLKARGCTPHGFFGADGGSWSTGASDGLMRTRFSLKFQSCQVSTNISLKTHGGLIVRGAQNLCSRHVRGDVTVSFQFYSEWSGWYEVLWVQRWLLVATAWLRAVWMVSRAPWIWFLVVRSEFLLTGFSAVHSLLALLAWLFRSGVCLQIKLYSLQLEETSRVLR